MLRYKNDADAVLHFLCESGWANNSVGGIPDTAVQAWRITNRPEDVADVNTEFNSVLECIERPIADGPELRQSLVGHFIVMVDTAGNFACVSYESLEGMMSIWSALHTLMEDAYDVQ